MPQAWQKYLRFMYVPMLLAGSFFTLLFLPIIIPVVGVMNWRDQRRMRALAKIFECKRCGQILGDRSISLADEKWAEILKTVHRADPVAIRYRIVRTLHAICTQCDMRYQYMEKTKTFVSLAPDD